MTLVDGGFGMRLRLLRLQRGLTQAELAERAGINPATVSRLEASMTAIRPSTVKKLAGALGIPVLTLTVGHDS